MRVALPTGADQMFDYLLPEEMAGRLTVGQRILVGFGRANRPVAAFCVECPETSQVPNVKSVTEIIDPEPLLDAVRLKLARWIAQYYVCPLGVVLAAMVPAAVKQRIGIRRVSYVRLLE
ncbi:MAG: hypothetical protein JW810_10895, partial [Sedimentisphaerales bacterium]|nr:hypothetical protein [Sedimentisphaerales bacterium]